jgi:hypothetical protein
VSKVDLAAVKAKPAFDLSKRHPPAIRWLLDAAKSPYEIPLAGDRSIGPTAAPATTPAGDQLLPRTNAHRPHRPSWFAPYFNSMRG